MVGENCIILTGGFDIDVSLVLVSPGIVAKSEKTMSGGDLEIFDVT